MPDTASPSPLPPLLQSFDDPLGRKIVELHVWAVGEGLRGTEVAPLFDGLCQRLVIAGVPLWRTFAVSSSTSISKSSRSATLVPPHPAGESYHPARTKAESTTCMQTQPNPHR